MYSMQHFNWTLCLAENILVSYSSYARLETHFNEVKFKFAHTGYV